MNLHETEYGRRFFNSQLPSLIKALERIAENLSAPKQSLSADFVADPDFLHDLYYCINGFKTIKQRGIMAW